MRTWLALASFFIASCTPAPNKPMSEPMSDPNKLVLLVKIKPEPLAIGYADIFGATVEGVVSGVLVDKKISMTIMSSVNDTTILGFFQQAQARESRLRLSFEKHSDNEPHHHSYINGFVAADKRAWRVTKYELAE